MLEGECGFHKGPGCVGSVIFVVSCVLSNGLNYAALLADVTLLRFEPTGEHTCIPSIELYAGVSATS